MQQHTPTTAHDATSHCGQECSSCPTRLVCRCLRVTEAVVLEALSQLPAATVRELRRHTGAGTGCMACTRLLQRYVEEHASRLGISVSFPPSPSQPVSV